MKSGPNASVCPDRIDDGLILCDQTEKAENVGESDNEIGKERLEECEDDDFWYVASLKEEMSFDDFYVSNPLDDDFLDKDMEMVLVKEDDQVLATFTNAKIEEILKLNLEGINVVDGVEEGCSVWVLQNIQKLGKIMGIFLEGMKPISLLFFSEVEKMKVIK